jgi:EAL domain-containing protein (putative c-di-GMP-specific phosphodiesterase class I)
MIASSSTLSAGSGPDLSPHILLVDDEPVVARFAQRVLLGADFRVTLASGGREAIEKAKSMSFDAILSDVCMPEVDGHAVLRAVRDAGLDVPFVFLTGSPHLESAIEAIEFRAFRYLVKPVRSAQLLDVMRKAVRWHQLARVRKEAARDLAAPLLEDRAGLEATFAEATEHLWIAMQPIVSWQSRSVLAYEALLRTTEPTLRNPLDFLDAAEKLDATQELGRAIRRHIAELLPGAPASALAFVNLHPSDLSDPELSDPAGPLAPFAERIVLEVTERAALDEIPGLAGRIARLRELGFRIAVDDLGAGYAGLSTFASLEPDVVKADMSLIRDIHKSAVKQKVVGSIVGLCKDLGIQFVAEGIETASERDCVASLGGDNLQGYLFARPHRGFPAPAY